MCLSNNYENLPRNTPKKFGYRVDYLDCPASDSLRDLTRNIYHMIFV